MSPQTPIHDAVREHYAARITQNAACCGPAACDCAAPESNLYPTELLTSLPTGESAVSYGCGDPITLAALQPGQTVLDLGSGAGLDCFFAARKVGPTGRVIGVDMTPEMLARATQAAERLNLTNVEFRRGYIESLPVEASTVDVIISNCVINLAPDKRAVFAEAFRVLKPGGKLAVSDIVTNGPLPEAVKQSLSAWAGCVAGAVEAQEYVALMEAVGFTHIAITPVFFDKETVDSALAEMNLDTQQFPPEMVYQAVYSAKITAYKPA